jgi:hypothetical protein
MPEKVDLTVESDLTRLVRTLLQEIKRDVLANTSLTVSMDYLPLLPDCTDVVALSKLPCLVLSGPRMSVNRAYGSNEPVPDSETTVRVGPLTMDLSFTLTGGANRTTELLNLMAQVGSFLNQHPWLEMPRVPEGHEFVRWEMAPEGDFRVNLHGMDDVRVFQCGLVIRGFDLDPGIQRPLGGQLQDEPRLEVAGLQERGSHG